MVKKTSSKPKEIKPKDKVLSKISIFFFDRQVLTALLWIVLTVFGALSYGILMKREGFPSVNIPVAVVNGVYFANNPTKVDQAVAMPITEVIKNQPEVKSVQSSSGGNFFAISITYKEGVDAKQVTSRIEKQVNESGKLPEKANVRYNVPYFGATGGDIDKIDVALSFYAKSADVSTKEITDKAEEFASQLKAKNLSDVSEVFVKNPYEETQNPANGQLIEVQRSFDRFGMRQDEKNNYFNSVIVGVSAKDNPDVIKLDDEVRQATETIIGQDTFDGFGAEVSASFAPSIKDQISELQKSLLEGLIAVLIVGSIVITIRASLITVISMVTVVAITIGFLNIIGYTLNVITLFSLILALALMVDDTIIMVEAIDAARHKNKDRRKAVQEATQKVSRAMLSATLTASLSFAPLLFVSGMLGTFIRAVPVTVISALIISLVVALIFIPYFSKFILLNKKQMGKKIDENSSASFEHKIAKFITWPMVWARHSTAKLFVVGSIAMFVGISFFVAGILIARNVPFNIFPPTKDTNGLMVKLIMPPNSSIDEAESIADKANNIVGETLGDDFVQASYFGSGSETSASQRIEITSYTKREVKSPELVEKLQHDLRKAGLMASVHQVDVGPPASDFVVRINAKDRPQAIKLAEDMSSYMRSAKLKRPNGSFAKFTDVNTSGDAQYLRYQGDPIITVTASFDADDTSALVGLAETLIRDQFDADKLSSYGLDKDALSIDIGQESENQDSFKALMIAFPALLFVMYILLAIQFKSFLQPLLIYLAIPFSIFGIALGLDLTGNAFSFFAMLGFFALLGLSVKNTILLTDYANQARSHGFGVVDSAVEALRERFRPLFATSVTAVVSLIPLALTSPFWEGLMVVLIFGLISSTFLVITVFPYYYLGAEFLRLKVETKKFIVWLIVTLIFAILVGWMFGIIWSILLVFGAIIAWPMQVFWIRRLNN